MRYILIIGLFLASCNPAKKLNKLMDKLPEATAKQCAERYPIKEKIDTLTITDTSAIKAYESELFLLWKQLDSVLHAGCDTLYIEKIKEIIKTKPVKVETKYIIKTQESTAKLQAAKDSMGAIIKMHERSLIAAEYKINEITETANKRLTQRNRWFLLLVLMTIFAFRRQLLKIIK